MKRIIFLVLMLLMFLAPASYSAVIEYYVDGSKDDDTGAGTSWAVAKKTIYGCVAQVVTDLDGVTANSATINISGSTSGRTYAETHNLILSKGTHYPAVGGGSLKLHDGASGKEWTIKGSTESGHDGQVTIDATGITTWQTYNAVMPTNLNYVYIKNVKVLNGNTSYDDFFFSIGENALVEYCILENYGVHAISMDRCDDSIIRYNSFKGQNGDNSSAVKLANTGADDSLVYYNTFNITGGASNNHFAFQAYNAQGVEFSNNTIYGTKTIAIGLIGTAGIGSDGCILKNNIISSSTTYEIMIDENTSGIVSDYNCWYRPSGDIAYIGGTFSAVGGAVDGVATSWADWQTAGYDANGFNADPLFLSTSDGDLRLSEGSPGRGVGVDVGFSTDARGREVNSANVDMGGSQSVGGAVLPRKLIFKKYNP